MSAFAPLPFLQARAEGQLPAFHRRRPEQRQALAELRERAFWASRAETLRPVPVGDFYPRQTIVGFDYLGRAVYSERGVVSFWQGGRRVAHVPVPISCASSARVSPSGKWIVISCRTSWHVVRIAVEKLETSLEKLTSMPFDVAVTDNGTLLVVRAERMSIIPIGARFPLNTNIDARAVAVWGNKIAVRAADIGLVIIDLDILLGSRCGEEMDVPEMRGPGDLEVDPAGNIYFNQGDRLLCFNQQRDVIFEIGPCPAHCRLRMRNDGLLVASSMEDCRAWA